MLLFQEEGWQHHSVLADEVMIEGVLFLKDVIRGQIKLIRRAFERLDMEVGWLNDQMYFDLGTFRDAKLILLVLVFVEDDQHERLVEGIVWMTRVSEHTKGHLAFVKLRVLHNHVTLVIQDSVMELNI